MPHTCFITHKNQLGILSFGKSEPLFLPLSCSWEILLSMNEYFDVDEKETCAMIICYHRRFWKNYEDLLKKDIKDLKSRISILCNIDEDDFYGQIS